MGDAYDNALAETIKRSSDSLDRIFEPIGDIPPAEFEKLYYEREPAKAA